MNISIWVPSIFVNPPKDRLLSITVWIFFSAAQTAQNSPRLNFHIGNHRYHQMTKYNLSGKLYLCITQPFKTKIYFCLTCIPRLDLWFLVSILVHVSLSHVCRILKYFWRKRLLWMNYFYFNYVLHQSFIVVCG